MPHPTAGASTVLFWHYIAGFRAAGFDILSILLTEPANSTPESVAAYRARAQEIGVQVVECHAPAFLEERRHAVGLRTEALGSALAASLAFRPDVTFCLDFVAGWAAGETSGPRVVWLGDLRFQSAWYHALYEAKERRVATLQLPLAVVRSFAWRRAYRRALATAAAVIVSSKSSEAQLQRLRIAAGYQPYPWPAEPTGAGGRLPDVPTFLFLGTLQALGSRSAFHFILHELYPELVRRWGSGGFRIVIAGRGELPAWAAGILATTPELEHVGFVDDLAGLLASVHAAIAPISVPVGNRSRVLTALAAGTVVVAHENAALGNPELVDGVTCFLAADAASFAERMARTVDDPAGARDVAARGQELYRSRFRPDAAVGTAVDTLAAVLTDATSARNAG